MQISPPYCTVQLGEKLYWHSFYSLSNGPEAGEFLAFYDTVHIEKARKYSIRKMYSITVYIGTKDDILYAEPYTQTSK